MKPKQPFRAAFLQTLKHTLNPITRRLARTTFGPFAIVRHVGRRSGKVYETPIIVSPVADGFVIELTYGKDVDWHKNLLAAGGGTLIWHGAPYEFGRPVPLEADAGKAAFPVPQRLILGLLKRTHFEKLSLKDASGDAL